MGTNEKVRQGGRLRTPGSTISAVRLTGLKRCGGWQVQINQASALKKSILRIQRLKPARDFSKNNATRRCVFVAT